MNETLIKQAEELLKEENTISAISNITALIKDGMEFINWAGYYFYKNGKLVLGPFQGKVACTQIEIGKGVCGTAYEKKMLLNIDDVSRFDGHIVCDPASCSELVAPLIYENRIFGVLDIDSNEYRRFSGDDEETLDSIAKMIAKKIADN